MKDLVDGAYLLDDVITFNEQGVTDIPAFTLAVKIPGFDARRWHKPAKAVLHVLIAKTYKSYFVFHLHNKYGETLKLALPMEDHAALLPVPYMSSELRIARFEPVYAHKGDRQKNIFTIPLTGEMREVYRYGMVLFMDKHGILDNADSEALTRDPDIEFSDAK